MAEEKKYSLISVDTGSTEVEAGVRTRREVVNGEETIVVSSSAPMDETADMTSAADHLARSQTERANSDVGPDPLGKRDQQLQDHDMDDDQIPFRRMQGIIIVCLIVLIAAFLIYFNFVR